MRQKRRLCSSRVFSRTESSRCYLYTDFWTTRCTRCPQALDDLDRMAADDQYKNVNFVAICCDQCDGAREILERDEQVKWQGLSHYYMANKDKETAKKVLGFSSVPFYVVLNEKGEITQKGNKVDFSQVPGKQEEHTFTLDEDF